MTFPTASLAAQGGGFTLNAQAGFPQYEFAKNVAIAGGFGAGLLFPIASELGVRAGFDLQWYGRESQQLVIPAGAAGNIVANVVTTNSIAGLGIGAQLGMPGPRAKPYLGGMLGFSHFRTQTSASGEDSDSETFASKTNASDNAFAKHVMAGIYYPLAGGDVLFDLGGRYTWNGRSVRYLTRGDISEDAAGNVQLNIRESRADLITVTLGVTIRFSSVQSRPR